MQPILIVLVTPKKINIWHTERDGIFFLLSDDNPVIGDYFVYLKPNDKNLVLFGTESLRYSEISIAKILFYYDRNKRSLGNLIMGLMINKVIKFDYA